MANPLYQQIGAQTMPGKFGDMENMVNQIRQFASTLRGDPREIVQQKLNSGEMSQAQYNELMQTVRMLAPMFK